MAKPGRLDQLTPERLDPLINGLNRAVGRAENTASEIIREPGRSFGNVFALQELWRDLGIDTALTRALRSSRREIDAGASPLSLANMYGWLPRGKGVSVDAGDFNHEPNGE